MVAVAVIFDVDLLFEPAEIEDVALFVGRLPRDGGGLDREIEFRERQAVSSHGPFKAKEHGELGFHGGCGIVGNESQGSCCGFAPAHSSQCPDSSHEMVAVGCRRALNECALVGQEGVAAAELKPDFNEREEGNALGKLNEEKAHVWNEDVPGFDERDGRGCAV